MASPRPGAGPLDDGERAALRSSDTREQLIAAAMRLMGGQPWERVSARAVAQAAGLDPALVTYHFGGRSGLVVAVAERATTHLRSQMRLDYDRGEISPESFRTAIMDGVDVMLEQPLHAQLYVDELLLHGDEHTDEMLHALAAPYFASVRELVGHARREGMLQPVPDDVVVELVICLSLVYFFLSAALRRYPGSDLTPGEARAFVDQVIDLVLRGSVVGGVDGVSRSLGPVTVDDGDADPLDRDEVVGAAIEMLRQRNDAALTPATVAVRMGQDASAVLRVFPSRTDLLDAVARTATSLLAPETPRRRPRGRPRTENPEVRADLLRAAAELIERERRAVTARAVAARAGCDPALVTYYFGSRRGLLQALARQVVGELHSVLLDGLATDGDPLRRIRAATEAAVRYVATRPGLSHVLLDEFLIHGTTGTDEDILELVSPGLGLLDAALDEAQTSGLIREAARPALLFQLVALPVFVVVVMPTIGRALGGPGVPDTTDDFVGQLSATLFDGVLTPARPED